MSQLRAPIPPTKLLSTISVICGYDFLSCILPQPDGSWRFYPAGDIFDDDVVELSLPELNAIEPFLEEQLHAIPEGWYAYRHHVHETWQYYQHVTYTLDGNTMYTLDDFYDAIERELLQGKQWGRNFDALHDILRGNYHNLATSFTVVWKHSARSQALLNHHALADCYREQLQRYGGLVPLPVLAEHFRAQYAADVRLDAYAQKIPLVYSQAAAFSVQRGDETGKG